MKIDKRMITDRELKQKLRDIMEERGWNGKTLSKRFKVSCVEKYARNEATTTTLRKANAIVDAIALYEERKSYATNVQRKAE